jgi:hypothetical protein
LLSRRLSSSCQQKAYKTPLQLNLAKDTASAEMSEQEDVAEVMDLPETKEVPVEVAEEALEVEEVFDIVLSLYLTLALEISCPAAASMELVF